MGRLAAAVLAGAAAIAIAPPGAMASVARHDVVTLLAAHAVHRAPSEPSPTTSVIGALRPITRGPTVLPIVGRSTEADGTGWLRVMLPGRPNGQRGWIVDRRTVSATTPWRVIVHTATRRILVYRGGRLVRSIVAIVGKPSTPTPHGRFFVEENVRMSAGAAGGPFALALSARSNVLQEFEGGPGQIALHGIANLGGTLGSAESHGCVRMSNRDVTWLAARIEPGDRVTIGR